MHRLRLLPGRFAVCRLPADAHWPTPPGDFVCVTRTAEELSLVCAETDIPAGVAHNSRAVAALDAAGHTIEDAGQRAIIEVAS